MKNKTNNTMATAIKLALTSSLIACQALMASDLEDNWYVGGSFGKSNLSPDGHDTWNIKDTKDVSKKIYAGVDISSSVGIETFWTDFGSAAISNGKTEDDVSYQALGVNTIYHPPVNLGWVKPFAKLGAAKLTTKAKKNTPVNQLNEFDIFAGLGADFALTPHWAIRTEFEYFDRDINHLGMGFHWRPDSGSKQQKRQINIPAALPLIGTPRRVTHQSTRVKSRALSQPNKASRYQTITWVLTGESNFKTARSGLNQSGIGNLTKLMNKIKRSGIQVGSVLIVGHTDSVGNNFFNQRLSTQRANSVANFMAKRGIPWQLIKTVGRGEASPIASNDTPQGRARNRRVEITVQGIEKVIVR